MKPPKAEHDSHFDKGYVHSNRDSEDIPSCPTLFVFDPLNNGNTLASSEVGHTMEWVESPVRAHSKERLLTNNSKPMLSQGDQNKNWVDSPIRAHRIVSLPQVDENQEWDESPAHICNNLAQPGAEQKEWRESPICKFEQNSQGLESSSRISASETPQHCFGAVQDSSQQAFTNLQVIKTSTPLCPVPLALSAYLNPGEHAQQNITWFCVSFAGGPGVLLRHEPYFEAQCTGLALLKNEVFSVDQEIASPDGRIYLHLTDGRGWAFDDSALAPQDPSVVRMGFSTEMIPSDAMATLQYGQNAQLTPIPMGSAGAHHPEVTTSTCVSCNCPIDANAKFCIICGSKQPSPPGIATPECEASLPYYQHEVNHPVFEGPWWKFHEE